MGAYSLPLEKLSVEDKLRLMEMLWDDLLVHHADELAAPAWHQAVLQDRTRALADGQAQSESWEQARAWLEAQIDQ